MHRSRPSRVPTSRYPYRGQRPPFGSGATSRARLSAPGPSAPPTASPAPGQTPPSHPLLPLMTQVLQEVRVLAGKITKVQDQQAQIVQKVDGIARNLESQAKQNFAISKSNFQVSNKYIGVMWFALILLHWGIKTIGPAGRRLRESVLLQYPPGA